MAGTHSLSGLEDHFVTVLRCQTKLPQAEREHRFAERRRYRFDLAWPDVRLGIEIHGATWSGGRHTRGYGIRADAEKLNLATELRWRVLVFTDDMIKRDPITCAQLVERVYNQAR